MNISEGLVWLIAFVAPAIAALAFGLVSSALAWLKTKTPYASLIPEKLIKDTLQEAINFGIGYAVQKAKEANLEVKFDNAFVAGVVQYVGERTPDALEHFGITPTSLETMVKARLGLLAPEVAALPLK